MRISVKSLLLALLIGLVVSGCGGGSRKGASQVAARVNGDEISVHQVNQILAAQGPAGQEQAQKATPQVLERLIDQQLMVQKAVQAKLDRDVQVVQRIEAAKSQIIAQTYMERMSATSQKASADEIRAFYKENPALFAERRVYRFEEIVVQAADDKLGQLEQVAKKSKSVAEVANWLKGQNIPFTGNAAVRAAEQLPLEALPQLSRMKDGDLIALRGANGVTVLQLAASQVAAISEEQATQHIQTFLLNRKRKEIANAEMAKLRAGAKIEYVGEFEKTKPAAGATSPAVTNPPKGDAAARPGESPAAAPAAPR
jgi:EpsD family peptidyl-prolyl cis-trans isomerase